MHMGNTQKHNQPGDIIRHEKLGGDMWVVMATAMTGGGTGHGPWDVYPDGHQLTLRPIVGGEIDWSAPEKKFYQSGCFIDEVMLPPHVPVIRTLA